MDQFLSIQQTQLTPASTLAEQLKYIFFIGQKIKVKTKTGGKEILIKLLEHNTYVDKLLALHESMMAKLKEEGKGSFLTKKTESDFAILSDLQNGITIGAFDIATGELIGQTSFSLKNLKDKQCEVSKGAQQVAYNPTSVCPGFECIKQLLEIKGIIVHSDYNGGGLSQHLIDFGIAVLKDKDKFKDDSIALVMEIDTANKVNLHVRMKDGFKVLQKYIASDGVECYLLYKPLGEELVQKTGFDTVKSIIEQPSATIKEVSSFYTAL